MRKSIVIAATTGLLAIGGSTAALADSGPGRSTNAVTPDRSVVAVSVTTISRTHADRIALQRVPGARITESELRREHGVLVWEIHLVKRGVRYEVKISAHTGRVLQVEREHQRHGGEDHRHGGHDD